MNIHLTDAIIKRLEPPANGNRITFDSDVAGFGIRVTAGDARSFILNYRTRSGRERRFTIGRFPNWQTTAARIEARRLLQEIDRGGDPLAELHAEREAPTIADLFARFMREHVAKRRPATIEFYRMIIENDVLPSLGSRKAADITFEDVSALHHRISARSPYMANRAIAVLSKMFALSIRWRLRLDNPCRGVERNQEHRRHRYLDTKDELPRLLDTLATSSDVQAANCVRMLLLTGARRNEVLTMRWDQIKHGVWTKPASSTKQKLEHRVPLSEAAQRLLEEIRATAGQSEYVFPGRDARGPRINITQAWMRIRKAAGLSDVRLHDLRHTYASVLVSGGASLPMIGALLGHTQPQTTARYAHLFDDPLRAATEKVGAIISGQTGERS